MSVSRGATFLLLIGQARSSPVTMRLATSDCRDLTVSGSAEWWDCSGGTVTGRWHDSRADDYWVNLYLFKNSSWVRKLG